MSAIRNIYGKHHILDNNTKAGKSYTCKVPIYVRLYHNSSEFYGIIKCLSHSRNIYAALHETRDFHMTYLET